MDKDMERLGKERLKRVRRRRQLATFIISMAVIVLGHYCVQTYTTCICRRSEQVRVRGGWTEGNIYQSGEA